VFENKYVFSVHYLKAFCDKSGDCNAGGRLFQVVGPLMAKLHCPVVVQARRTSSSLVTVDCNFCRCCWPDVTQVGMHRLLI